MNLHLSIKDIRQITNADFIDTTASDEDFLIKNIVVDSRSPLIGQQTLFVALKGNKTSGDQFLTEFQHKGGKFILTDHPIKDIQIGQLVVENTLFALQAIAAHHRQKFSIPVIGITGSNGKTTVKEWLYAVLKDSHKIVRSPKSYNSQLGVALSVLEMNESHNLAIFEAGISKPGEMERLEQMIKPTIGVFTGIGDAHNSGFSAENPEEEKKREKFILFKSVEKLFEWRDEGIVIRSKDQEERIKFEAKNQKIRLTKGDQESEFEIPFNDSASAMNAALVATIGLNFGLSEEMLCNKLTELPSISMRLEKIAGIRHNLLINDAYNLDAKSLEIGLQFLQANRAGKKAVVFLAEDAELTTANTSVLSFLNRMLTQWEDIDVIYFGNAELAKSYAFIRRIYAEPTDFLNDPIEFSNAVLLFTGSRKSHLEVLVNAFMEKKHITRLTANFSKMRNNLNFFRVKLNSETLILAMVKAQSYGGGILEVATFLEREKVNYFGVAYADEGVTLRKGGIKTPILVMNPEPAAFDDIIDYGLEPSIYSIELLNRFIHQLILRQKFNFPIHLKLDTGMNRLGFRSSQLTEASHLIAAQPEVYVRSVFSHLAAADEPAEKEYTLQQIESFNKLTKDLENLLGYSFIRHLANSAGAYFYPEAQFNMVRIGIGLYGLLSEKLNDKLENVLELHSQISQIRAIQKGETVGYGRDFTADQETKIGIVPVGYADGISRALGHEKWQVLIQEKMYPIIGKICMDMCMINLGSDPIQVGTDVQLFGKENSIFQMSEILDTIPYEIISSISPRVQRIYLEE